MSSASVLLLLVSLTSIDVRGPTAVLHATAFSEFRVFKGDTPITAFRYENDTLYLPDSGNFTVVFDTLALKPSYSYGGNARSDRSPQPDTVNASPMTQSTWLKIKGDRRIGLMVGRSVSVKQSLDKLGLANALIIDGREVNANFARAARNIPNIDVLPVQGINVYDILRRHHLVLTKAAVEALQERFQ